MADRVPEGEALVDRPEPHLRLVELSLTNVCAGEHELERYARTLTPSIRDDGRAKVLKGESTIEEVLRVTRED